MISDYFLYLEHYNGFDKHLTFHGGNGASLVGGGECQEDCNALERCIHEISSLSFNIKEQLG